MVLTEAMPLTGYKGCMKKICFQNEQGFTVVELAATIIVAAMFATMFYQLFVTTVQIGSSVQRDASASDIAYSYLKRYQKASDVGSSPSCSSGNTATQVVPATNGTNSNVGNYTISVNAYRPYPICQTNTDIIKVEAIITYQNDGSRKVTHATYIN